MVSDFFEPLKTLFLEVGVWGFAPHPALLLFAEKQKGKFYRCSLLIITDGKVYFAPANVNIF